MHSPYEFIDEQRSADYVDAMSDYVYEQEQAMRESDQSEWSGIATTSTETMMPYDNTNEPYV